MEVLLCPAWGTDSGASRPVTGDADSMATMRALPRIDSDNRDFWTGGEKGELRIHQCRDCKTYIHPPRPVCRNCLSEDVGPQVISGYGVIDSYTVNYQKWHPAMEVPFVIARVALDEAPGVYLTTNIIDCPVEAVDVDERVQVVFEQHEDVYLPMFRRVV
jgi:uncharacterized OB-fold protein